MIDRNFLIASLSGVLFLMFPIKAEAQDAQAVARGQYLARAADCVACHTNPADNRAFAGGYALQTPFGKLLTSNITQDIETGIGGWTEAEFSRALREGIGRQGQHLYPAMPYPSYTKLTDADVHDLWLYMKTITPVKNRVVSNQLPFPFNIRAALIVWNLWNFRSGRYVDDTSKSKAWNRGAYLAEGLEHCNSCHTPKNFLGGDKSSQAYRGASLQGWYAPDITNSHTLGIGSWHKDDLKTYLKTGSVGPYVASGPMGEAIENSTQYLRDGDLEAIATYFSDIKGQEAPQPTSLPASDPRMHQGKAVYEMACSACHRSDGRGVSTMITGFPKNRAILAPVKDSILHTILAGGRGAMTHENPTGAAMPSFAWPLSDEQIAAAATYIRNSWGNNASAVTPEEVKAMRRTLQFRQVGPVPDDWSLSGESKPDLAAHPAMHP